MNGRIKTLNANDDYRIYDSALEFYSDCKTLKSTTNMNSSHEPEVSGSGGWKSNGWYGTKDFETAVKLATTGWEEGVKQAEPLARRLSDEMVATLARPEVTYDVTGEQFDMGKVIEDEPECWMKWTPGHVEGIEEVVTGPIKIVLNCTVSAGVDAETIRRRGAAAMALAIVFEAANRPTRIEVAASIRGDQRNYQTVVCLKDFYDPLQADAVAFGLVHPSFFRRFIFKMLEIQGIREYGYGMPQDVKSLAADGTQFDRGDIYLGQAMYGDAQWQSEAGTEAWVRKQLIAQGVKFNEKD